MKLPLQYSLITKAKSDRVWQDHLVRVPETRALVHLRLQTGFTVNEARWTVAY